MSWQFLMLSPLVLPPLVVAALVGVTYLVYRFAKAKRS